MSIELRFEGYQLVCEWGVIDSPNPERGEVGALMVITRDYAEEIASDNYVHADFGGKHYIWELHEAHWRDGKGMPVYIGRWPD